MKMAKAAEPTITHDLTPDRTTCPQCGRPMTADYANRRTVHTLSGVTRLNLTIRRCHHPACAAHKKPYRPEAEGPSHSPGTSSGSTSSPSSADSGTPSTGPSPRSAATSSAAGSRCPSGR